MLRYLYANNDGARTKHLQYLQSWEPIEQPGRQGGELVPENTPGCRNASNEKSSTDQSSLLKYFSRLVAVRIVRCGTCITKRGYPSIISSISQILRA